LCVDYTGSALSRWFFIMVLTRCREEARFVRVSAETDRG
jgi:hypothetical protein